MMKSLFTNTLLFLCFLSIPLNVDGQKRGVSLERAIQLALQNNIEYNAYKLKVEQGKALIPTALSIDKATVSYSYDSNNLADNNHPLNIFGIEQSFSFPTLYASQYKVTRSESELSQRLLEIKEKELIKNVTRSYYEIQYQIGKLMRYRLLDTIFKNFTMNVEERYKRGEAGSLDVINAKAKHQQIQIVMNDITYTTRLAYMKLRLLVNSDTLIVVPYREIKELHLVNADIELNPGMKYIREETELQRNQLKAEHNKLLPEITLAYYNGSNRFVGARNYPSYEAGVSIPLFFIEQKARIKGGKIGIKASEKLEEHYRSSLLLRTEELKGELQKYRNHLDYYYSTGRQMSVEIEKEAREGYARGEIDYYRFVESIENVTQIELEFLDWLFQYNNTVLELNYLTLE